MKKKEYKKRPYEAPFMDLVPIMVESAILGVSGTDTEKVTEDPTVDGTGNPFNP